MTRQQRTIFGETAELYHRYRLDYPVELFEWLVSTSQITPDRRVVDVGCGTGKSSSWFIDHGFDVVGIEPDPAMGAMAEQELGSNGHFVLNRHDFQDWPGVREPVGLVISGQAWHWADPATRFDTAADTLDERGWLAVFWNRPDPGERPFATELDNVYADIAPHLAKVSLPGSKSAISAATPTDEFDQSERFGPVEHLELQWDHHLTAEVHCQNLRTQSDHRLLPEAVLEALIERITSVIEDGGGGYTQHYSTIAFAASVKRDPIS
jgi:SAM-dependent methyltransferase